MIHRFRRAALKIHLWSGLLLGAWFVLLGLTGSALAFYLEIDEALNPRIALSAPMAPPPSVDAIHQALRTAYPQRDGPWRIEMPMAPDMPVMARYNKPAESAGRHFAPLLVTLAPDTLRITSSRLWGDTAMTWIYDLHYTLLLGEPGLILVGIVGLVNAVMLLTGIWLWWPSKARLWAALRILPRPGAIRRTYDLHVTGGIYTFLLLIALALTGSALALPEQARAILAPWTSPQAMPEVDSDPDADAALSLDEAVAIAKQRFPDAELRWIETSGTLGTPIALRLHQPFEPSRRFPQSRIWLDPVTGSILDVTDPQENRVGDTIMQWLHPLHNGEALGMAGRCLVCLMGFVPLLLFVTGILRWKQKARARKLRHMGQLRSQTFGRPGKRSPYRRLQEKLLALAWHIRKEVRRWRLSERRRPGHRQ